MCNYSRKCQKWLHIDFVARKGGGLIRGGVLYAVFYVFMCGQ